MEIALNLVENFLLLCAVVLFVPSAFFLLECLVAPRHAPTLELEATENLRTVVLIPARDEAANLAATLESVRAALTARAEILVVADNCADETVDVARARDVRVIERNDHAHIGKGYALAFGVHYLANDSPEVVIVLDADCRVDCKALTRLAQRAYETALPVQAANRWWDARAASSLLALSNLAFLVKNIVRPMGLRRMGAPCLLTGNGMAFPWTMLANAPLATGHLSEDMWLSVELTCAGHAPLFCPDALVYSPAPRRRAVMKTQRARWERGHLETMLTGIPKLVFAGFVQRRWEPLWMALELSVPPLALLILLITILFFVSAIAVWFGLTPLLLFVAALNFIFVCVAVSFAWWKFARAQLSARTLLAAPSYVLWKIPLYVDALLRRRVLWTRTERDNPPWGEG